MGMKLKSLFHTNVGAYEIENVDYDSMIDYIYKNIKIDDGVKVSNILGWQSQHFKQEDHEIFKPIFNEVNEMAKSMYFLYGIEQTPEPLRCWVNVNGKNASNSSHHHAPCFFSVVVYLKVPENSGSIVFERDDTLLHVIHYNKITHDNLPGYSVTPKQGTALIFPANLKHSVTPNLSDDDRISIAMNFR